MSKRVLVYGVMLGGLIYYGFGHVNEQVRGLRTVNVSVPSSGASQLSVHQFYPVLAENVLAEDSEGSGNINDAFFLPPPEPERQIVDVSVIEVQPEEVVEEEVFVEPEPIDPINFLAQRAAMFRLQATMPSQNAAIINGRAFQAGDKLPGVMHFSYVDEYGDSQNTQLEVRLAQVNRGQAVLTGTVKEGWEQSLALKM